MRTARLWLLLGVAILVAGCADSSNSAQTLSPALSPSSVPEVPTPAPTITPPEVGFIGGTLRIDPRLDAEGVMLLATPVKVIGQIVRLPDHDENGLSIVLPESKFYIAVRLRIENVGSVPWRRANGDPSFDPNFEVFLDDPSVDARWVRPSFTGCRMGSGSILLTWDKKPMLPRRINPGEIAVGWLTLCVKYSDALQRRMELRDVTGDYVLAVSCLSAVLIGCPIWRFRLE